MQTLCLLSSKIRRDPQECDQSRTPHVALLARLLFDHSSTPILFDTSTVSGSSAYLSALVPPGNSTTIDLTSQTHPITVVCDREDGKIGYPLSYKARYSNLITLTKKAPENHTSDTSPTTDQLGANQSHDIKEEYECSAVVDVDQ